MFSRSKAASWRWGERTARRPRSARDGPSRRPPLEHPGLDDDGGEVDGLYVGGPVDGARVEPEVVAVAPVHLGPQLEEAIDAEEGLGLGVGAVELDVAQSPVGLVALLLQSGRQRRLPAPHGEGAEHPLGRAQRAPGPLELALYPTPAREGPLGHDDGLPVGVVHGVLGEVGPHQVDELAVAQGVLRARGHVIDDGAGGIGTLGHGSQESGGHQVDGDDVHDPLGDAGELAQQAPSVADDHGLGHAEAPDPARIGLGQGRLDDGWTHDRERHVPPLVEEGPFPQGLGVGVGVGPAQALGPGPSRLHQALLHPALTDALGPLGQKGGSRRAQLAPGLLREAGQAGRLSADGVGVVARPPGGAHLLSPIDLGGEGCLR